MTYDILITSFKKSKEQLLSLLDENNIFGNVLIGNQGSPFYSEEIIVQGNRVVKIFNLTNKGVSKNRNFLLNQSRSDFVLFLDDDVRILNYCFDINKFDLAKAYRFNLTSRNIQRPIKQINRKRKLSFGDLKSFGVWGIFFPRIFLVKNNIRFHEFVGPGCKINHGEDSLFLKDYLIIGEIMQINKCVFSVEQSESTWQGANRNIKNELISHGFVYGLIFGRKAKLYLIFHLIKNKHHYNDKLRLFSAFRISLRGYELYKKSLLEPLSNCLIDSFFNEQ